MSPLQPPGAVHRSKCNAIYNIYSKHILFYFLLLTFQTSHRYLIINILRKGAVSQISDLGLSFDFIDLPPKKGFFL